MKKNSDIYNARQLYRLCCGIEFALVEHGYRATVADAIKAAGMSRRTFYEIFESMHQAYVLMQIAMGRATEREFERIASVDMKDRWHHAYANAQSRFPSADSMLGAMACDITIDANRSMNLVVALDTQSYIACEIGMRPLPEPGPFDEQILQWAKDMRLDSLVNKQVSP